MRLAPPYRPLGAAFAAVALVLSGLGGLPAQAAATAPLIRLAPAQILRSSAAPISTKARVQQRATQPHAARPPVSTWNVTYTGFTPEAKAAFQAAVDTWAGLVASSQPINVCATFKDLGGGGVLGQAGPTDFALLRRDGNGGDARTYYPLALANALSGSDLSPVKNSSDPCSGSDITAEFSSTEPCVYYGTDGAPPARCTENGGATGYVDFETIVLHELGHGLGFLGSADVANGYGFFGTRSQPDPTIFDRFVAQSAGAVQGKRVVTYASGTTTLAKALTSNALYWDGAKGKAADRGRPPRLYAPSQFAAASSFSHLYDTDFPATDPDALMTPFIGDGEVIHDPGQVVLGIFGDMGWGVPTQPGVGYTPVAPVRVLDTRSSSGRLGTGRTIDVTVVGGSTGIPTAASAVVLNVTGIAPPSATDLRVYPTPRSGGAEPLASNLNLTAGAIRANLATVPVGTNGQVRILNSGGAPNVLVDVQGWYGADAPSRYEPATPVRLLDTRDGTGATTGPVQQGGRLDLQVTGGARNVPADATAVVLTVTALNATTTTDVRVYPTPTDESAAPPEVSNVNLRERQIVPNLVIAKVGAGGRVRLMNSAGAVDLVADLAGWYDGNANGSRFHLLAPQRVLDTRTQSVKRLGPGEILDLGLAGLAGVPSSGAQAVVVNVTGVDATQTTDVAVYPTPDDGRLPTTSNLNVLTHETAADLAIVGSGAGGAIRLRNAAGELALVVDIVGWFGP